MLVTGAGGFIGSHLVERLVNVGAQVRALVRYNSKADIGNLRWLPSDTLEHVEIYAGNICAAETVARAMCDVDIVFHLAASVSIPYSYKHPREVADVNIMGTLNVLTAALDRPVERLLMTSTSEVYGTAQYVPIDENHPRQAQSPYAASKIGADALALSFHKSYGLPVSIVRPFNTYGPRQSARAVIPTIIAQALTASEIHLGNTDTTRDFNYVSDTVEGFLMVASSPHSLGEEINIGSGAEISIADLSRKIVSILGKTVTIRTDQQRLRPDRSEVMRLLCASDKARRVLGWHPTVSLEQGILTTAEWIEQHVAIFSPQRYSI